MAQKKTWFRTLTVYGTIGYGKSHIVAALALALMKERKRVIYLPDCAALKGRFLNYLKQALSLTFVDNEDLLQEIFNYKDFDEILERLEKFKGSTREEFYLLVDQWNAIEPDKDDKKSDDITKIRRDLEQLAFSFYFIKSASANNMSTTSVKGNQTSEITCNCFGGFTEVFSLVLF